MICEVCRYSLPDTFLWRVRCNGCRHLHALCVECGCRYSRRTGLQREPWFGGDVWGELDACPDVVVATAELTEAVPGEPLQEAVWRLLRTFSGEPLDERTARQFAERARGEFGLPAAEGVVDLEGYGLALRFEDGRMVGS